MTSRDNTVPKWAFLVLLLIFLLFGETKTGGGHEPDATVATTSKTSRDLPSLSLSTNHNTRSEAK